MQRLMFGIDVSTSAAPGADPVKDARTVEALGFDFVSASDHPSGNHPSYETWTMLSFIAAATYRIGVATRVLSLPFRSPALVAKMAESLDRMSGGRLILGLGAGATDQELRAFGLAVPSPREKIDGLDDALQVISGLWTQPAHTYHGRVHRTEAAAMEPKPAHRIPVWLGTFGDRALAITGRLADGWIPSLGYAPFDQLSVMRAKVLAAAESAGRTPEEITCALNVEIAVDDNDGPSGEVIRGSVDEVAEQLGALVTLGFTAFNFMPVGAQLVEQAEQLATEVVPRVRSM
ncbi:MAG: LLM class flavin-dependent oxidoreductase [Acidimicrobiales bacterium]|jgi:alkanesulfonate monooxygenase SsuD/methylene tetrahydromethanopterin reductase-like flavin-dependent oxidoreductase (luciferase family)